MIAQACGELYGRSLVWLTFFSDNSEPWSKVAQQITKVTKLLASFVFCCNKTYLNVI